MTFDVPAVITWILFLALFPMAFSWLRPARRIGMRRDFSQGDFRRGDLPLRAQRWAAGAKLIHALAGRNVRPA